MELGPQNHNKDGLLGTYFHNGSVDGPSGKTTAPDLLLYRITTHAVLRFILAPQCSMQRRSVEKKPKEPL